MRVSSVNVIPILSKPTPPIKVDSTPVKVIPIEAKIPPPLKVDSSPVKVIEIKAKDAQPVFSHDPYAFLKNPENKGSLINLLA